MVITIKKKTFILYGISTYWTSEAGIKMTLQNAIWEIICGSLAGALGKFIDYPFDTIKVRMQTQGANIFPTTWSCIQYTYKNEGILTGFYQGLLSPLLGASLENAILFVSYNQCYNLLKKYTQWNVVWIILISGSFSGSCASFVLTPVELIKCKLQLSNLYVQMYEGIDIESRDHIELGKLEVLKTSEHAKNVENGDKNDEYTHKRGNDKEELMKDVNSKQLEQTPSSRYDSQNLVSNSRENYNTDIIPTIKAIIKENGVLGLWQGQLGTFIREAIGSLIWFGTFQLLKRLFMYKITGSWVILDRDIDEGSNPESVHIPSWVLLVSGAIAGFVFNGSVFPIDTIKSVMQTEQLGFRNAINYIYGQYGFGGFYRGLTITLIRSMPSNAAVFYTYEQLTKLL